jgi:hypothetical protein
VICDNTGKVLARTETHYMIGRLACSPAGDTLATSDLETGVIRIYDGQLKLMVQRFAIDLLADARQLQLLADLPPVFVAINALTMGSGGLVAFSMSGILCVTTLHYFQPVTLEAPTSVSPPEESPVRVTSINRAINYLETQRELLTSEFPAQALEEAEAFQEAAASEPSFRGENDQNT